MSCYEEPLTSAGLVSQVGSLITVASGQCSQDLCILYLEGPLRVPLGGELDHRVLALLEGGERTIVLDLAQVSTIDAAGVGKLVRAYNMTNAMHGALRITHATAWVREILQRAGLFGVLGALDLSTRAHGSSCGTGPPVGGIQNQPPTQTLELPAAFGRELASTDRWKS
jgi:anti-sigma B factor antagonist